MLTKLDYPIACLDTFIFDPPNYNWNYCLYCMSCLYVHVYGNKVIYLSIYLFGIRHSVPWRHIITLKYVLFFLLHFAV